MNRETQAHNLFIKNRNKIPISFGITGFRAYLHYSEIQPRTLSDNDFADQYNTRKKDRVIYKCCTLIVQVQMQYGQDGYCRYRDPQRGTVGAGIPSRGTVGTGIPRGVWWVQWAQGSQGGVQLVQGSQRGVQLVQGFPGGVQCLQGSSGGVLQVHGSPEVYGGYRDPQEGYSGYRDPQEGYCRYRDPQRDTVVTGIPSA